jgi:hypothetical protein
MHSLHTPTHSIHTPHTLSTPSLQATHTHLLFTPRPFSHFISATTQHTPHPQNAAFLTFLKETNTANTARAPCSETCQTQASRMLTHQGQEIGVLGCMFSNALRQENAREKKGFFGLLPARWSSCHSSCRALKLCIQDTSRVG